MKKYDIVYSITAHEAIDCVWNLYENIMEFHPGLNVLVVFHTSKKLYRECEKFPERDNLWFHPIPKDKARFTSAIFLAHLKNYSLIERMNFDLFCTLASNCMFVRPYTPVTPAELAPSPTGYSLGDEERWQAQEFLKNPKLVDVFERESIKVETNIHEGAYFRKETIEWIVLFCWDNGIDEDAFLHDTLAAEEVILPSLEKRATGRVGPRYAAWIPGITLEDVKSMAETGTCRSVVGDHFNIVKIPRKMDDPMRIYINELMVAHHELPQTT